MANYQSTYTGAQIDNAIGKVSTIEGEVNDIRVGYDGTTYPSAGDAVRGQVSDLKSTLNELSNDIYALPCRMLTDVVYDIDGNVRSLSGYVCLVYELEQLAYHIKVEGRTSVSFGLSNTLFSGTQIKASTKISEETTEYDYVNNQNYKYLYITKSAPNNSYGVTITTSFSNLILGDGLATVKIAGEHLDMLADYTSTTSQGYIISTTGVFHQVLNGGFYSTDYIDVEGTEYITLLMPVLTSSASHAGAAFYTSDKTYISGVESSVSNTAGSETRTIIVPSNAKYVRTTSRTNAWSSFFIKRDDINTNAIKIANLENINAYSYGMQMFQKIGVISDSISCGWALDKNGNSSRRNLGISWVQQMARRLGCTAYNLGASGVDPIEWFQSNYEFYEYCLPQYQSVGECDLYIIGLGLNGGTLGSVSDINQSDYTQNGATFYGQYARIIQMINNEHPDAIVICLTEPTTAISGYDQAVRNICALNYINAELVDLEHDYFDLFNTSEIIAERQPDGLHYTPYGYSLLADAMIKALNDYIANNSANFKYVGVTTI